jgi:hypothetical protein
MPPEYKPPHSEVAYHVPRLQRLLGAGLVFMNCCVGLWIVILVLWESVLQLPLTPPQRMLLAAFPACPGALSLAWWHYRRRNHLIVITPELLEIHHANVVNEILPSEVIGLIALPGISLEGEEMMVWKKVVIVTLYKSYAILLGAEENARCFEDLRQCCLYSWTLPFRGDLVPPAKCNRQDRYEHQSVELACLERFYRRQIVTVFWLAAGSICGGLAVIIALVTHGQVEGLAKAITWSIVLFVVGVLLFGRGWQQTTLLKRIRKARQEQSENLN